MNLTLEAVVEWCRREGVMLAIAPMTGHVFVDDKRMPVEELEARVLAGVPCNVPLIAGVDTLASGLEYTTGIGSGFCLQSPGYESLAEVLYRAFGQAADGKGAQRHGNGLPFDQQPMQSLQRSFGPGFALGQAAKKIEESQGLPLAAAVHEMLGAINYIAGAVIFQERSVAAAQAAASAGDSQPGSGLNRSSVPVSHPGKLTPVDFALLSARTREAMAAYRKHSHG